MSKPFSSLIEERKSYVNVLILGPYSLLDPHSHTNTKFCENMLKKLKFFLKEKGFYETHIVLDWIDEDNIASRRAGEKIGGQLYKKYRIFSKTI